MLGGPSSLSPNKAQRSGLQTRLLDKSGGKTSSFKKHSLAMTLHHLGVLARDFEKTRKFYCERLGITEESRALHPHDAGTEEAVFLDQANRRLVFHFYPRSHRGRPGLGGGTHLYLLSPGEKLAKLKGKRVIQFGQEYLATVDPDGLRLLVREGSRASLLGLAVISDSHSFWEQLFHIGETREKQEGRFFMGNDGAFLECVPPAPGALPSRLGFGSIHHLALTAVESEKRGLEKPTCFGVSRYFYSPCGLLYEIVDSSTSERLR